MVVVLLLALIWAAVLVPPAVRAHAARREAFLVSFGRGEVGEAPRPKAQRIQRRRRIAGGLLVAMAATLVVGLLPTFRVLLVVHLFLVDSFIAYIAILAHAANRAARGRLPLHDMGTDPEPSPAVAESRRRRLALPRPPVLPDLGPIAPAR